jgi:hypothetical protein
MKLTDNAEVRELEFYLCYWNACMNNTGDTQMINFPEFNLYNYKGVKIALPCSILLM